MHILFLNSWYPNRNAPTLGNFVKKHAEAAALYNTVSSLAIFPSDSATEFEVEKNETNGLLEVIVYFPIVKNTIPGISQLLKLKRYKRAFKIGLDQIERAQGKIDVTHLNVVFPLGIFALELKKKRNIPFVVTEHSTAYHDPKTKFSPNQLRLIKKVLPKAAIILPVSYDLGMAIGKLAPEVTQQRITNVVDAKLFQIVKEQRSRFLHISTLDEAQKNPKGIIDVISQLNREGNSISMRFISDFPYNEFEDYAKSLGLTASEIEFCGPMHTHEIAQEIQNAKAVVLFSNYENFPCVIAESFMCGVPVIATHVNGIPEYVDESNGILVSPRNTDELKAALLKIESDQIAFSADILREFAVKNFSYEAIGKEFSDVYYQVIKNAR